ncbi:hypothetical protein HAX54_029322, partial [Datura stramonium]|nr:hypothetical protein [Datura stramonium]
PCGFDIRVLKKATILLVRPRTLASALERNSQPQWAISRGMIHRRDLKFEARMRLEIVCARLIPSQNTTEVPIEVVILIACIMDHVHINVGEIIADQFKRRD